MLPFKAKDARCFEVFNPRAVRPTPGTSPFQPDSAEYKQNANAVYEVSLAFNERVKTRAGEFKQGLYSGSALLERGAAQYSCHKDDAAVVKSILDELKAEGLLESVEEIPYKQSMSYALSKATFTPHKG